MVPRPTAPRHVPPQRATQTLAQDVRQADEIGVVVGEVALALPELLEFPSSCRLLTRVSEDTGELVEERGGRGQRDVARRVETWLHRRKGNTLQQLEAVAEAMLFTGEVV